MKNESQKVEKLTAPDLKRALNINIMKNLFLTLAFVFATSISFAGNNSNEIASQADMTVGCFNFTLSCGVGGTACGDDTAELIDLIMFVDDIIC